jgi:hypothetical protein
MSGTRIPRRRASVTVARFRDDDPGYAAWLAANAHGFVLNIQRSTKIAESA